ncbi:EAL domain-containing protein [Rhodobacterales bacterium]|nr:EAL domain-containing protein [Rhodobacterales bacterium]
MVLCSIGFIASLSYIEHARTTSSNSDALVDRAARTAATVLSVGTHSAIVAEDDAKGNPQALRIADDRGKDLLAPDSSVEELITQIARTNDGTAALFTWSSEKRAFDRIATTVTGTDGSPAISIETGHQAFEQLSDGKPYIGNVPAQGGERLAYLMPILTTSGKLVGALAVDIGWADDLSAAHSRLRIKFVAAALVILAIAVLIGNLLLRRELHPLRRLAKTADDLASGIQPDAIPYCDRSGEIGDLAHGLEKVTDLQDKLQKLAYTDPITTAGNRTRYFGDLSRVLKDARTLGHTASLLHLDFQGFAKINDTFGQQVGNRVLLQAYARLANVFGSGSKIARISGDDFCIIIPFDGDGSQAECKAAKAIEVLSAAFYLEDTEICIEPCIGIALLPADAQDVETAHRITGLALRAAEEAGEPCYRRFSAPLNERVQNEMLIETLLRVALRTQQMTLYYQPQVCPTDAHLVGVEALLRWPTEKRGFIPPSEFIPIAEKTGLILELGQFVLNEACKQAAKWVQAGFDFGQISVNVSPIQFKQPNFARTVKDVLATYGLSPRVLCLEMTENVFIDTSEKMVLDILSELQDIGVQLSLDDFGSGYSSLSYLHSLPFQELKIDRSFLANACNQPQKEQLFQAIAGLGRSLGLRVIAEGAETAEEFALCAAHRCDGVQGYFCSPAVPAMDIETRLEAFRRSVSLPATGSRRTSRKARRA